MDNRRSMLDGPFSGGNPPRAGVNANVPRSPGLLDPIISDQGNNLGDTAYVLLANPFDVRVVSGSDGNSPVATYTGITPGYQYTQLAYDYILAMMFDNFRMRQEPASSVINDIIANIADIARMVGIYCTALTLKQSRDPEMFQRARALELHNTLDDMMNVLTYLPLPANVLKLVTKYVRLMDVSSVDNYQNIGFLVSGDFAAFQALFVNVRSRSLALNFMRKMYPLVGQIGGGDPSFNPDVMEAWVNATLHAPTGSGYSPYLVYGGSSQEPQQLASGGVLHSVINTTTNRVWTVTGFGIPGSGFGATPSQRSYLPFICRWNGTSDAAVTRVAASANYSVAASVHTAARVLDADLARNISHEYNMSYDGSVGPNNYLTFDQSTGALGAAEQLTEGNTRYRVSAGFSLAQLSYSLDGNIMTVLYNMLAP